MILSPPQADQSPSMKFKSPDSVTWLFLFSCSIFFIFSLTGSFSSPFFLSSSSSLSFFFSLCPVRSSEQSMSSITIMDLLEVSISNFLNSVLSFTAVSSRS
ncbi:hypothetical protein CDL12_11593 [Handroanthus impetiginosus]|uniref:Uncharacterized protein n=1 Tax=Handroanthus impetiginosus TaxID=429701 RepID=A0A2G9HE43_9LAMI|nr:hypothetical protein CDL12_11593 [Handroanthus impetiginosus]